MSFRLCLSYLLPSLEWSILRPSLLLTLILQYVLHYRIIPNALTASLNAGPFPNNIIVKITLVHAYIFIYWCFHAVYFVASGPLRDSPREERLRRIEIGIAVVMALWALVYGFGTVVWYLHVVGPWGREYDDDDDDDGRGGSEVDLASGLGGSMEGAIRADVRGSDELVRRVEKVVGCAEAILGAGERSGGMVRVGERDEVVLRREIEALKEVLAERDVGA
ncbi:MAG: hypothetical protein M1835_007261 [Candelina submexicana]|nr:MAG: hypothetical protein M1835_007261 [Candelina submexicana]